MLVFIMLQIEIPTIIKSESNTTSEQNSCHGNERVTYCLNLCE